MMMGVVSGGSPSIQKTFSSEVH